MFSLLYVCSLQFYKDFIKFYLLIAIDKWRIIIIIMEELYNENA